MHELLGGWRFALRRLRAGWRFMLVAAIGMVVAVALMAAAPIYANTMSDLGLRFRLEQGLDDDVDRVLYATVHRLAAGDPADLERRRVLGELTRARLGALSGEVLAEARTSRVDLTFEGSSEPDGPLVVREGSELVRQPWGAVVVWPSRFEDNVRLVAGRFPGPAGPTLEAVLPDGFQRHAALGDHVRLAFRGHDDCQTIEGSDDPTVARDEVQCEPTLRTSSQVVVTIVGFVTADDPTDLRWRLAPIGSAAGLWTVPDVPFRPGLEADALEAVEADGEQAPAQGLAADGSEQQGRAVLGVMPLLTTEEQFFGVLGRDLPDLEPRYRVGLVPDLDSIGLGDVSRTIDDIAAWSADITQRLDLLALPETALATELYTFRNAQTFSQVPLLLILLQVVGIALFYVVLVMKLLLDRQAEEIGVYVGRGASTTQIVGLSVVEGLVMAIPATVLGPWLAAQAVRVLGYSGTFESVTGGAPLPASVTSDAYLLAAGGALLAMLAMLLPALTVARRGIIDAKRDQARPAGRGLVQRYYLDMAVVALAALLLWQLEQRGSVFDPNAVGGWSTDPMLLMAPLVFTVALAGLLLRFYPPLLRLAVRLLMVLRGTAVAIGLRRAGRAPALYARLMLLVVMAISVGTFAASYGPTVDLSYTERISYDNGVPFRARTAVETPKLRDQELADLRALEVIGDAALLRRGTIRTPTSYEVPLLALDVARARQMLWFRDDLTPDQPLERLLGLLESAVPAGGGLTLPPNATGIEFAVFTEGPLEGESRGSIRAIFRGAEGNYGDGLIDNTAGRGWLKVSGKLPRGLAPPLTLVSLRLTDRNTSQLRSEGAMYFDNFAAVVAGEEPQLIESFEDEFRWTLYAAQGKDETFERSADRSRGGRWSAKWTWEEAVTPVTRVLALNDPTVPVAALMNDVALGAFGTVPGGIALASIEGILAPLSVRGEVSLFPTMAPEAGIVVVNYDHLRSLVQTLDKPNLSEQNELWAEFAPGVGVRTQERIAFALTRPESPLQVQPARSPQLLSARLDEVARDPTLQASGGGILGVAFVAVLGLSTLGFIVTLVLSARSRTVEFAVLRILGISARQILRSMLLEWGTVLVIGSIMGALLGRQVARIMLSFLNVTDQGERVLPPFTLETDWAALAIGVGVLASLVVAALGVAWATTMRRATAAELRVTQ